MASRKLTVVIMARLLPQINGGVEQAVMGTVAALGRLNEGDEQYIVVTDPLAPDWLNHCLGPNTRAVVASEPHWRTQTRRLLQPFSSEVDRAYITVRQVLSHLKEPRWGVGSYDPLIESLMADVIHFPYQWMHLTSAPSIFNPQDLQHAHHPEFFDAYRNTFRQHMYPLWCNASTMVEVPSHASKDDLVTFLGVPMQKVAVVPKAPPHEFALPLHTSSLSQIRQKYDLPSTFILYPAQTWPHKNHERLFAALALLRDRYGVRLPLVCTGRRNDFWSTIRAKLHECGLTNQVRFPGYVSSQDLQALYHLAEFTVFPTLFEGGGLPLLEAFHEGSPLACSNIPVLAEQAHDAALLFDPLSVEDMARSILRLLKEPCLRDRLRENGLIRLKQYSWEKTARTYRAMYRKIANRDLTEEDKALLCIALT